jgi:hypothetical protein
VCCATVVVNGGTLPNCTTQSIATACVASCPTAIQITCQATDTLQVCVTSADCANDPANPDCCTLSGHQACVNDTLKLVGGLRCN